MKDKIYIIGIWLMAVLPSCQTTDSYENSHRFSFSDFTKPEILDTVAIDNAPFLSVPLRILCVDSILFVQNRSGEYLLEKYLLPSLQPQDTDCIPFGHGPGELLSVHRMQVQDSLFWLSDKMGQCCMGFDKKEVLGNSDFPFIRKVDIKEPFCDIVALPDNRFVATVLHPEHKRLSFFDSQGTCLSTQGDYPNFGVKHSALEQIESYICEMVVDSKNRRLWLFYMLTDLIEIYDFSGNLIKRLHGPDGFFPSMKEMALADGFQKVSSVPGETRDAYFCPQLSGDKLYVLYSGRPFSPDRALSAYLLNHLLVFDSDGKPYKHYELSVPVYTFAIDEGRQELYGLSFDPEYHLVKYKLTM